MNLEKRITGYLKSSNEKCEVIGLTCFGKVRVLITNREGVQRKEFIPINQINLDRDSSRPIGCEDLRRKP